MTGVENKQSTHLCCPNCKAIYRSGFTECPKDQTALVRFHVDPMIGSKIGEHYEIEACVGEGGMGRVYLAHHARLTRKKFAVKVLLGELAADPKMRLRFEQEAKAASRLDHPNIVSILDYGKSESGLLYIVMEFVEGQSLAEKISQGPMSESETVRIVKDLCLGLCHAHENGLVHRDFKPENVMLAVHAGKVSPQILDFGLAIVNTEMGEEGIRLTSAGLIVGTPAYLSPEQARAQEIDHRSDIFALGVTMYEMLAGQLPFDGDVIDMMHANATQQPPPIAERTPGVKVNASLESIVFRLMNKEKDGRYQSTLFAHTDLELLSSYSELTPMPDELIQARNILETARTDTVLRPTITRENKNKGVYLLFFALPMIAIAGLLVFFLTGQNNHSSSKAGQPSATRPDATLIASANIKEQLANSLANDFPKNKDFQSTQEVADGRLSLVREDANQSSSNSRTEKNVLIQDRKRKALENKQRTGRVKKSRTIAMEEEPKNQEPAIVVTDSSDKKRIENVEVVEVDSTEAVKTAPGSDIEAKVKLPKAKKKTNVPLPVPKPALAPKPMILDANTTILALSARGSLSKQVVGRAVSRVVSSLGQCYRSAAVRSKKNMYRSVSVHFEIDERGRAKQVKVGSSALSGLSSCISKTIKKVSSRVRPDVGTVQVSLKVKYTAKS